MFGRFGHPSKSVGDYIALGAALVAMYVVIVVLIEFLAPFTAHYAPQLEGWIKGQQRAARDAVASFRDGKVVRYVGTASVACRRGRYTATDLAATEAKAWGSDCLRERTLQGVRILVIGCREDPTVIADTQEACEIGRVAAVGMSN